MRTLRTHPAHHLPLTRTALLTVLAVLALVLTACGSGSADGSDGAASATSRTEHNNADVEFASDMIQHHAMALVMVDMTLGRDVDPDFARLTDDIRAAQTPEIETMSDWLVDWDEKIPATVRDHANAGHGMGGMGGLGDMGDMGDMDEMGDQMPGMMTGAQLSHLRRAPAEAFEDMWLRMMIVHHEGAIEMAKDEIEDGQFTPAVELARHIASSQAKEIRLMRAMVG